MHRDLIQLQKEIIIMIYLRIFYIVILIFILSCNRGYQPSPCLEEPDSDNSAPQLKLRIEYFKDQQFSISGFNHDDEAVEINADSDYPILVKYSGEDPQGLKSIHLSVVVKKNLLGEIQKKEYNIMPLTASCPKAELSDLFKLERESGKRKVEIQLKGANWMNLRSATRIYTIIIE